MYTDKKGVSVAALPAASLLRMEVMLPKDNVEEPDTAVSLMADATSAGS